MSAAGVSEPGDETASPLPDPDSSEVKQLLPSTSHLHIYRYLHSQRANPPTMQEIRSHIAEIHGGQAPAQTDRRLRDLRDYFAVETIRQGQEHRYVLRGRHSRPKDGPRRQLSERERAQVLAPQRCAQCGMTPLDHHIVLVVDHKLPRDWGGSDTLENLQPLCERCNSGKQAWFATYDEYADQISQAAHHEDPYKRIGELLKAFEGDWVPSELIKVVASMQQHQDDWQRRLREIRNLGWIILSKRTTEPDTKRSLSWYRVAHWEPWPSGSIRSEIKRIENERKKHHRLRDE
ncbi:HNH endonuclease [Streptomyces ovatisporus]|uniref:HNH endonuclease n=1 Tax=Streptomyces ovatisporus TaxID=1128682 RepID=A0ABV9A7Q5_9ACTN